MSARGYDPSSKGSPIEPSHLGAAAHARHVFPDLVAAIEQMQRLITEAPYPAGIVAVRMPARGAGGWTAMTSLIHLWADSERVGGTRLFEWWSSCRRDELAFLQISGRRCSFVRKHGSVALTTPSMLYGSASSSCWLAISGCRSTSGRPRFRASCSTRLGPAGSEIAVGGGDDRRTVGPPRTVRLVSAGGYLTGTVRTRFLQTAVATHMS